MDNKKNKNNTSVAYGKNGRGNANHKKKNDNNHRHSGQLKPKKQKPIGEATMRMDDNKFDVYEDTNPAIEMTATITTEQASRQTKSSKSAAAYTKGAVDSQPIDETDHVKNVGEKSKRNSSLKKYKEEKRPRTFQEIMNDLADQEVKPTKPIDRCIALLDEIKQIKNLSAEQVQFFFATVNEWIENGWAPFLAKATMNIDPNKMGNDRLILTELVNCFADIMDSSGLSMEELATVSKQFMDSKDIRNITAFLKEASKPCKQKSNADAGNEKHEITQQELACVVYSCLIIDCRRFSPADSKLLVKVDRAIAEHFGQIDMRAQAGKTVGSVLTLGQFSPKKIADLIYMYDGTAETIEKQANRICALSDSVSSLQIRNAALCTEINRWKGDHADLVARVESLENEGKQLRKDLCEAESMLEYERNKYDQQMSAKEAGLAEQLASELELEIQAIRETAEYIDEDNQRRIFRRLKRIDDILMEFGGSKDAQYRN